MEPRFVGIRAVGFDAAGFDAVGFDLDYTLWDQDAFFTTLFEDLGGEFGRRLGCGPRAFTRAGAAALAQLTPAHPGLFDRILAQLGCWNPGLVAELVQRYRNHRPAMDPYPGARETLAQLRTAGYRLFLVTDGHPPAQRHKVAALGLDFHVQVFTGELPPDQRKPNPEPFRRACAELGVAPQRCLYVGDHPALDVPGPRALGMVTAGVSTGPFARQAPPPHLAPHLRLAAVGDLAGLLAGTMVGIAP